MTHGALKSGGHIPNIDVILNKWHVSPEGKIYNSLLSDCSVLFVVCTEQLMIFWGLDRIGRELYSGRCIFNLACLCTLIITKSGLLYTVHGHFNIANIEGRFDRLSSTRVSSGLQLGDLFDILINLEPQSDP